MRPRIFLSSIFILATTIASAESQSSALVVSQETQRLRDDDRRFILQTELQAERDALTKTQAAFAASPSDEGNAALHRHAENIKALQRELDGAAGKQRARASYGVTVKARRSAVNTIAPRASSKSPATFWDPYNRVNHSEVLTTQRSTP